MSPVPIDNQQKRADLLYLQRLLCVALLVRLGAVGLMWATDAIRLLRLSPDSERYHRFGLVIMQEMEAGYFNGPNWIDNGWFQFTGLVYYLFGPHPILIQLLNVGFSCLTIVVVFKLALTVSKSSRVARLSALMVALFPSFIYWSCLMLKDPLAILMMSMLVLGTIRLREHFTPLWLALVILALTVFLGIREYMFFVGIGFIAISFIFFTPYRVPRAGSWIGLATLAVVPMLYGFGWFGVDYFSNSIYTDIDYINHIRVSMGDHGSGALFQPGAVATWGGADLFADIYGFLKGIMFFFITLNPTDIGSVRQLMALPEAIVGILLLPYLVRGLQWLWLDRRSAFPLLVFGFGVMLMLVSATTNMGALFRWRMQVMPLLIIAIVIGIFWLRRGLAYRIACQLTGRDL